MKRPPVRGHFGLAEVVVSQDAPPFAGPISGLTAVLHDRGGWVISLSDG